MTHALQDQIGGTREHATPVASELDGGGEEGCRGGSGRGAFRHGRGAFVQNHQTQGRGKGWTRAQKSRDPHDKPASFHFAPPSCPQGIELSFCSARTCGSRRSNASHEGVNLADAIYSKTFAENDLANWKVAHEMSTRIEGGSLIVSDSVSQSYHLLRISGPEFVFRLVTVRCLIEFLPTASANFYIHHFGNLNVAEIDAQGAVVDQGISRKISINRRALGLLDIEVTFLNCHPSISIGSSDRGNPVYVGTGRDQFAILSVTVETSDATAELSHIPAEDRITLVDVGGQGGLQTKWMLNADRIIPIVFEPIAAEAAAVRETLCRIPGAKVIERALADVPGKRKLYVAASSDCSSLREPNFEILQNYPIGRLFETVATLELECVRYDQLFSAGVVPQPDIMKIDVQGFEFEVLVGMGDILKRCLAVELETHLLPIYRGQKLTCDITELLWAWGFSLKSLRSIPHFSGDCVECDAFFLKRDEEMRSMPEKMSKKISLISDIIGK
ncbi:hypothetical protein MPLDJ20_310006 [Mesorhizobium plurifarium]|uniref:Methyltransferase FkbM domain-containing protein n=1 Tax=Mesorhizobium plurifarium TaxID=69974 RepID=A0A090FAH3_MESPL|nr:hypothetical protein MPLDJ20_310006 [Mesorhizobium plurifarium]